MGFFSFFFSDLYNSATMAMQHSGGVFRDATWSGVWPPTSSFDTTSSEESALLEGCTVVKIYNLQFKKAGGQAGYLSGKKTSDQVYKCVGVQVSLTPDFASSFATFIGPFFSAYLSSSPSAEVEHASAGDGRTYTFYADADQIARVRAGAMNTAGDPLKEGDVVTIRTRGNSLFVRELGVTGQVRDKSVAGMHQVTNMYHAKAVNVDEGLVANIAKAQTQQALLAKKAAEEEAKKNAGPKDVEDSEWD